MPIYEYRCLNCEQTFEVLRKFSDAPLTVHEACGGQIERLLSAPGFHLKGTGWYATDYAKAGSKSDSKDDKNTDSKPSDAKNGESKTGDSKPGDSKAGATASTSGSSASPSPTTASSDKK